ncbi:24518_t:CDS:1, partial [Gigaspora rosea]
LLGAYLASSSPTQSMLPPWFDNSLINATNWLKENNPYIRQYSLMIPSISNFNLQFPIAVHSSIDEKPSLSP